MALLTKQTIRSVSMDSWTDKQISMMRQGGNDEFNVFLEKYSVKKSTPIPQVFEIEKSMNCFKIGE
jgi:Putative GTPase activating protein for Arf